MTEVKDSHRMELERVTKKAQDLESEVKRLREQISSLDANFSKVSKSLREWETRDIPYCNVTHMRVGAQRALDNTRQYALEQSNNALTSTRKHSFLAYNATKTKSQRFYNHEMEPRIQRTIVFVREKAPVVKNAAIDYSMRAYRVTRTESERFYNGWLREHVGMVLAALQKSYEVHLEEHFDAHVKPILDKWVVPFYKETLLPIYSEKIVPFYKDKAVPAYQHYFPIIVATTKRTFEEIMYRTQHFLMIVRVKVTEAIESSCRATLQFIDEKDTDNRVPVSIKSIVAYIADNASRVLNYTLNVTLFAMVWLFRSSIRKSIHFIASKIIWLIMLPFRMVWFLCPLRFLFGKKKKRSKKKNKVINKQHKHATPLKKHERVKLEAKLKRANQQKKGPKKSK